ncbi:MAG: hypothetical protein RIT81_08315 [Deltaproteobacteria bacterium]
MSAGLVLMLGAVASVGVAVQDARAISANEAEAVLRGIVEALDARTGSAVADQGACEADCVAAVRRRTGKEHVVLLRVLAVPSRVRVLVEHAAPDGATETKTIDVSRNASSWRATWLQLAAELFPDLPPPPNVAPPPPALVSTSPEAPPSTLAPWVVAGVGVAAAVVGVGFGLSSRGARSAAANAPKSGRELADLESRAQSHGVIANVSFGAAAVAGIAAIVLAVY